MKMRETDLAKGVITWLQDLKWDVYQEVQVFSYGAVADIVGLFGGRTWVIETKTSLSLKVIEQADHWRHFSNLVSVAVPRAKRDRSFAKKALGTFGIGLIAVGSTLDWVDPGTVDAWDVSELLRPKLNRRPGLALRRVLMDEHKTFAEAGNTDKLRWSPFQGTCQRVRAFVEKRPGATLKEIVDDVPTHYRSVQTAKICISKWVDMRVLKGVRREKDGKTFRFYPVEEAR